MKDQLVMLELAIRIAVNAHAGQLDKAGVPYILHPLRVMNTLHYVEDKIVGVLHDTVEDTDVTFEVLAERGFSDVIIAGVDSVTHRKGESWKGFIARCKVNDIGRRVKKADMRDNSDLHRLKSVEEKHLAMIRKYHYGMQELRTPGKVYVTS